MLCETRYLRSHIDYSQPGANDSLNDVVMKIRDISEIEWFQNQTAVWGLSGRPEFIESLTKRGIGWTFNMIEPSKLFTNK
jgi:hypothetical protein